MRRPAITLVALGLIIAACGGSEGAPATTSPSSTSAPGTTTATTAAPTTQPVVEDTSWFASLAAGVCFDDVWVGEEFDFTVPPAIVPCEGPHDNEVVAMIPFDDDAFPGAEAAIDAVEAACTDPYRSFFGSDGFFDHLTGWMIAPDEADWEAGSRVGACVIYSTEPMRGTAFSAGLTAPGTILSVVHEVDGVTDIWLVLGDDGSLALNVSNSATQVQRAPAGWDPAGEIVLWGEGDDEPSRRIVAAFPGEEPTMLLGALDVPAAGSPAVNPADPGLIALIAAPDGGEFDIYLYDGATDTLTPLTADNPDRDTTPVWSPDGTRIAYRARSGGNSDVWVMDADGSNKTRLTTDSGFDGDPRWSPDGSQLLFTSDRTGDYEIWIMDVDGSNQRNLTNHPADDEYPTWSPDGSLIAFHSDRHGGVTLWLMRADGSDQSALSWMAPIGYPSFAPVTAGG